MKQLLDFQIGNGNIQSSTELKDFISNFHLQEDEYTKKKMEEYLKSEEV